MSPRLASRLSHDPPCGLPYSVTVLPASQQASRSGAADSVGRLRDERGWLGAPRLLRHSRISHELREAAGRTEPHLERVLGVWPWILSGREVVAGGLLAQVKYQMTGAAPAGTAGMICHLAYFDFLDFRDFALFHRFQAMQIIQAATTIRADSGLHQ